MLQYERWKIILVVALSLLGVLYAVPNLVPPEKRAGLFENIPGWLPSKTVNLGLDLRGGSHLLMEADMKAVLAQHMTAMRDSARRELRSENIGFVDLQTRRDGISFQVRNPEQDIDEARSIARKLDERATVDVNGSVISVTLDDKAINAIKAQVIEQSIEIVRRRVDETGTKEPIIQRQGADRIVIQLPGVDDPSHMKEIIGRTAKMAFHLLDEDAMASGQPGPGSLRVPVREREGFQIIVKRDPVIEGKRLIDAQPSFDMNGSPVVSFKFDSIGAKVFCDVTRENTGKPFAIVMDNERNVPEVITYPNINEPICGGAGQITGGFTVKEANDLALLLRAGALPAPLSVVEERSVGPTLGSDSVEGGKMAAMVAFAAVFILMIASYGLFGLFADIALMFNIAFIFALLSMLQATLTLPGIAGIILTIGIAVDANVLVYERIREELRAGRSVISSVDKGYEHALRTIFDSNLTTLIVALILFSFGSGPVKGFAVAMSIGIVTSLFASIMITRLLIVTWLKRARPTALAL